MLLHWHASAICLFISCMHSPSQCSLSKGCCLLASLQACSVSRSCYKACLQIKDTASTAFSCFELHAPDMLCLGRQLRSPLRVSSLSSSSCCTATGQPTGSALLCLAGRECAALLDPTARTTAFWYHVAAPTRQVPQQPSARSDTGTHVCHVVFSSQH